MYSSHLIVVVVGFADTLIDVNETDGQATLNVSITQPLPMTGVPEFQLMFELLVNSMDDSAGIEMAFLKVVIFHELSTLINYQILVVTSYVDGWKDL